MDTLGWWYLFDIEARIQFWAQAEALCRLLEIKIIPPHLVGLCDGVQYVVCA